MNKKQPLLIELLVEELPPKALKNLGSSFAQSMTAQLQQLGLVAAPVQFESFASPRRLAVCIENVQAKAADRQVSTKLMPAKIGLDSQGQATAALSKKLLALKIEADVSELRQVDDGKNQVLYYDQTVSGIELAQAVQQALEASISKLPIPKVMSYQLADGWSTVQFVRPAHGLVVLYGDQVVPNIQLLGLTAGRHTSGHRFEANSSSIEINHANDYAAQLLQQGAVIANFDARRNSIVQQLQQRAASLADELQPIDDPDLVDEVTALVERPNVVICQFEPEYLQVPQECLILTMKANQKYFPLLNQAGQLSHKFLVVSNLTPVDASAIIAGNERVIEPRLADAKFFFEQDKKTSLASRLPKLDKVVYHHQLGSQGQRIGRVSQIATMIAEQIKQQLPQDDDFVAAVTQAAQLAKTDLVTDMVGEFPELQGIMGRYYALNDGLSPVVADAIAEHYQPRFSGDSLPNSLVATSVALADKLETLIGMFGIGNLPSGDKDPYALRRHALGVIRMLMEKSLPLPLDLLFKQSYQCFGALLTVEQEQLVSQLQEFFYQRLAVVLKEQGYQANEIDAVLTLKPQLLADIKPRLQAVRNFLELPQAEALASANKRVNNILKKNAAAISANIAIDQSLLQEPAEIALWQQLTSLQASSQALLTKQDYQAQLSLIAELQVNVDNFFTQVMVMTEDLALRQQRLALLKLLHQLMTEVADLSKL